MVGGITMQNDVLTLQEIYDKLAKSQADVEAGRLRSISEVFDKYIAKYGVPSQSE